MQKLSPKEKRLKTYKRWTDEFGSRLREAFGGANNATIARKLEITDTGAANYLDRNRLPVGDVLLQIADLTDCSIHWVLTGEGSKHVVHPDSALPPFSDEQRRIIQELADSKGNTFQEEVRELVLTQLISQGLISEQPERPVVIKYFGGLMSVPLLGYIEHNKPLEVPKNVETVRIAKAGEFENKEVFALRVKGTSLEEEDLHDGDLIVCIKETPLNGDRVVALINGKAAVKRFYRDVEKVTLKGPSNSNAGSVSFEPASVEIQGVVVGVQN